MLLFFILFFYSFVYNKSMEYKVRKANYNDINQISSLAGILYSCNECELIENFNKLLSSNDAVIFVTELDNKIIAFAQCQLRYDYVEGTNTSPVAYLEGIFVVKEHRNLGIAKELVDCCQNWAKEKECTEFASDCQLTNTDSYNFHKKVGFIESNRIICFKKNI